MPKNIVICCDGTENQFERHNTNVVLTFQLSVQSPSQITYYSPGVGTFSPLGRVFGERVGEMGGSAFGWGITALLEQANRFLMEHFEKGDKIFLFGFSRGGFAMKALAGMLDKVGLLQKGRDNLLPYAIKMYHQHDKPDVVAGFKQTYCRECIPRFIGLWDTVASLGMLYKKRFPDIPLHKDIEGVYHAMSIDENRRHFPVALWDTKGRGEHQTIAQLWFAGVHSDVGGGYAQRGLSDISLEWVLKNAVNAGLKLKAGWQSTLQPDPLDKASQHDESKKLPWRLFPTKKRKIPEYAKLHNSVETRMKAGIGYCPTNLPETYSFGK